MSAWENLKTSLSALHSKETQNFNVLDSHILNKFLQTGSLVGIAVGPFFGAWHHSRKANIAAFSSTSLRRGIAYIPHCSLVSASVFAAIGLAVVFERKKSLSEEAVADRVVRLRLNQNQKRVDEASLIWAGFCGVVGFFDAAFKASSHARGINQ